MDFNFVDGGQISTKTEAIKFELPKFGKSTTDPTYFEPSATRIANMKKASGLKLEGIYDFYTKDDVSKFNENNFDKNISLANVDPRFSNKLLREEISQITNSLGNKADEIIETTKKKKAEKTERINESLEINQKISEQNNNTEE